MKSKAYILSLAAISLFALSACSSSKTEEKATETTTTQQSTTEQSEQPTEKVSYDVAAVNVKITDSFNESVQFNQNGEDGYEWTAHIYELKLKDNGAINATVNDSFSALSDTEKTEVLNSVSRLVNMIVFLETEEDRPYFITAYDQAGNKVAQSHMTNVLEYDFE